MHGIMTCTELWRPVYLKGTLTTKSSVLKALRLYVAYLLITMYKHATQRRECHSYNTQEKKKTQNLTFCKCLTKTTIHYSNMNKVKWVNLNYAQHTRVLTSQRS